jgi:hypothetical protein
MPSDMYTTVVSQCWVYSAPEEGTCDTSTTAPALSADVTSTAAAAAAATTNDASGAAAAPQSTCSGDSENVGEPVPRLGETVANPSLVTMPYSMTEAAPSVLSTTSTLGRVDFDEIVMLMRRLCRAERESSIVRQQSVHMERLSLISSDQEDIDIPSADAMYLPLSSISANSPVDLHDRSVYLPPSALSSDDTPNTLYQPLSSVSNVTPLDVIAGLYQPPSTLSASTPPPAGLYQPPSSVTASASAAPPTIYKTFSAIVSEGRDRDRSDLQYPLPAPADIYQSSEELSATVTECLHVVNEGSVALTEEGDQALTRNQSGESVAALYEAIRTGGKSNLSRGSTLSSPDFETVDGPVLATEQLACGETAGSVDSKKAGDRYDSPLPVTVRLTKARLETHRRSFGKEKSAQKGRQQQVSAAGAITQNLAHTKSVV